MTEPGLTQILDGIDSEELAELVERLVDDFCEEQGGATYEAEVQALSGHAKADGHPILKITVTVRPHLKQEVH